MFKYLFFILSLFISASHFVWAQDEKTATENTTQTDITSPEKNDQNEKKPIKSDNNASDNQDKKAKAVKLVAPISTQQQSKSDIQHYLPKHQIKPILAGPNDYITLVEEHHTAINKGVAILVPDWPIGAITPKSINYLRKKLPQEGWTTITVHPSEQPLFPIAVEQNKEKSKNNDKATAPSALDEYQKKLAQLMDAVMEKAKEYPGIILVIAEGHHAAMLVNIYSKEEQEIPSAMVMLSAYLPTEKANIDFAQKTALLKMPVLDLFLKHDHPLTIANSTLRKKAATKEIKVYYRQQRLNNLSTSYYPQEGLSKAINGWLRSIGW